MNRRTLLTMIVSLLLGALSVTRAEPKAYELVKYQGKSGGLSVLFDFAEGYWEASALKIVAGGKTTKFNLDLSSDAAIQFAAREGVAARSKMNPDDTAPATVSGSYVAAGKAVPFVLKKGK